MNEHPNQATIEMSGVKVGAMRAFTFTAVEGVAWTVAAGEAGAGAASSSARTVSCSRRPPVRWQDLAPYIWFARPHR